MIPRLVKFGTFIYDYNNIHKKLAVHSQVSLRHFSVNACCMPESATDGCHVTTVEGLGCVKGDNLHPIQRTMVELHGSQCGFCTPGIIMAIYGIFANDTTVAHLEENLDEIYVAARDTAHLGCRPFLVY
jgi:xanthine dehydrogenase iron-sulfur cluster and FAD-binding subunit A